MTNSTFSGNTASNGFGGGIYNQSGTVMVTNSAFSGNTVSNGGGGIYNDVNEGATVALSNSIVAGNTTGPPNSGDDCDGCGTPSSNLISTPGNIINPLLAPLGNYGGPTPTMVPLAASPALNAGQYMAGEPTTDQRGFPRPATTNAAITLGAVQVQGLIVTTALDQIDASPDCISGTGNTCSLRDAMTLANSQETADILFAADLSGSTIDLSAGTNTPLPAITANLTLMGPGAGNLTVSGGGSVGTLFTVNSGAVASISGLTIANGTNGNNGAGIYNSGTLALTNSTLSGNQAIYFGNNGGGIYNSGTWW